MERRGGGGSHPQSMEGELLLYIVEVYTTRLSGVQAWCLRLTRTCSRKGKGTESNAFTCRLRAGGGGSEVEAGVGIKFDTHLQLDG